VVYPPFSTGLSTCMRRAREHHRAHSISNRTWCPGRRKWALHETSEAIFPGGGGGLFEAVRDGGGGRPEPEVAHLKVQSLAGTKWQRVASMPNDDDLMRLRRMQQLKPLSETCACAR
jgi:hypothetical protein